MKDISSLLELMTIALSLLKTNENKQNRKNIKRAFKNYKKIRKIMKRDGISDKEKEQLEELVDKLVIAQSKLL